MHTKPPQGVLLDVDGTLLDSNDQHARAWVDALREDGVLVELAEVRRLIGMGGDQLLPRVSSLDDESERGRAITARRKTIFRERYLPTCRPFPRARDLVIRMRDEGLRVTVATSSAKDDLAALLGAAGVEDVIEGSVTSSDAARSKPEPDIVEAAVRRAGLPRERLVLLGDTPYDVEAAARAGVRAIALRSGGWTDRELAGAVAVYQDVADLLRRYDESPLGRARPDASARTERAALRRG